MRQRLTLAIVIALCGCRSTKSAGTNGSHLGSPAALDASTGPIAPAVQTIADAATTNDSPPAPHVATEAELSYVRKLRALAYRCKSAHIELACTEGRLRAMDVPGLHCGHDAVAQDLRFAWAATRELEDATQKPFGGEVYWVEARSALQLDDIDRIDQEPMFLDGTKGYRVSDAYDGNNVIVDAYHIRFRRPWLTGSELARVRALWKAAPGQGGLDLAILKGEKIVAMAAGDLEAAAGKRLAIQGGATGLCAKVEDWQLPDDLESAFDPAPP